MTEKRINKNILKALGSHFAVLGSDIRIIILRLLSNQKIPIEFNEIHKILQPYFSENINTAYHLKKLKNQNLIIGDDKGYLLTDIGTQIVGKMNEFEEMLTSNPTILVRTSKYSLEPFDESIIEKNLILEANMIPSQAKSIANEAKIRLKKANVTYLTTPLIREYINAILIENQYEDYRHKLTRLGLPPYDIEQLLQQQMYDNPDGLKKHLGTIILEQYLLLNQIPQKFADNLLSGKFILSDLKHFGLTPIELIISGKNLISILSRYHTSMENNTENPQYEEKSQLFDLEFSFFLQVFQSFINKIQPFFSKGLVIIRFDEFLEKFNDTYTKDDLKILLTLGIKTKNQPYQISLGISLKANLAEIKPLLELYLNNDDKILLMSIKLPNFQIHYDKLYLKEITQSNSFTELKELTQQMIELIVKKKAIFDQFYQRGNPKAEHIYSNLKVPLTYESADRINPSIIMEKISINVLKIYLENEKDEKSFFKQLEKAIYEVFDYFDQKSNLLIKNINSFREWPLISSIIFKNKDFIIDTFTTHKDHENQNRYGNIYSGISVHGLNEIIYLKSKLSIRDQSKNRDFLIKILDFIYSLIQKQNQILPASIIYVLCQPHIQKEITNPSNQILKPIIKERKSELKMEYEGYFSEFHNEHHKISLNSLTQMYSEIAKSKNREIILNIPLNSITVDFSMIEGDFQKEEQKLYYILKTLINTRICGLKFI